MKVLKEVEVNEFEFWAGAKDTIEELTSDELEIVWDAMEDIFNGEASETQINDFFWFERDYIAELLGYNDFDEIIERNK